MSVSGASQGSGDGRGHVDGRQVHRLPLLHDHVSVSHSALSVGRVQSPGYEVRTMRSPAGAGLKPGCTSVCPTGAVIFGPRHRAVDRGQAPHQEQSERYYQNRVYGETDNGGTQSLYLTRSIRKARIAGTRTGIDTGQNAPLAKAPLSILRAAGLLYAGLVQVIRKRLRGDTSTKRTNSRRKPD